MDVLRLTVVPRREMGRALTTMASWCLDNPDDPCLPEDVTRRAVFESGMMADEFLEELSKLPNDTLQTCMYSLARRREVQLELDRWRILVAVHEGHLNVAIIAEVYPGGGSSVQEWWEFDGTVRPRDVRERILRVCLKMGYSKEEFTWRWHHAVRSMGR